MAPALMLLSSIAFLAFLTYIAFFSRRDPAKRLRDMVMLIVIYLVAIVALRPYVVTEVVGTMRVQYETHTPTAYTTYYLDPLGNTITETATRTTTYTVVVEKPIVEYRRAGEIAVAFGVLTVIIGGVLALFVATSATVRSIR
ncbi:MAG: hypothetical protein QW067_09245 [Thermofilaceae archaeon]